MEVQIAGTERRLQECRQKYLQQVYRILDDQSLLRTEEEKEEWSNFRSYMAEQTFSTAVPTSPSWLAEYWQVHPYDPEKDRNTPMPSPAYIRDFGTEPYASNQELTDALHQFRRKMVQELIEDDIETSDAYIKYWLSHPINANVDDATTFANFHQHFRD